jgi:hypothetical protein
VWPIFPGEASAGTIPPASFLCVALALYSILLGKNVQALLAQILSLAAAPAFAFAGGYLRQIQKNINRAPGIV